MTSGWQRLLVAVVICVAAVAMARPYVTWRDLSSALGTCTMAGCFSQMTIRSGLAFTDGEAYDIEMCLDDECWDTRAVIEDDMGDYDGPLGVSQDGVISITLEETSRPIHQAVTLVVVADGEEVLRYTGEVAFEVSRPNGRFCDPTCYYGEVVL